MVKNSEITRAVEVLKEVCETYKGHCLECPLGYTTSQVVGSNCRLQSGSPAF